MFKVNSKSGGIFQKPFIIIIIIIIIIWKCAY